VSGNTEETEFIQVEGLALSTSPKIATGERPVLVGVEQIPEEYTESIITWILTGNSVKVMSLYNKIIHYFDVTPGSQITWVTCSGIVNKYAKAKGDAGVRHLIKLLTKFIEEKSLKFESMNKDEQEELLGLFSNAPGDFRNLILGHYGKLPMGWPPEWVYRSTFGDEWKTKIKERVELSPLDSIKDDNLDKLRDVFWIYKAITISVSFPLFLFFVINPDLILSKIISSLNFTSFIQLISINVVVQRIPIPAAIINSRLSKPFKPVIRQNSKIQHINYLIPRWYRRNIGVQVIKPCL